MRIKAHLAMRIGGQAPERLEERGYKVRRNLLPQSHIQLEEVDVAGCNIGYKPGLPLRVCHQYRGCLRDLWSTRKERVINLKAVYIPDALWLCQLSGCSRILWLEKRTDVCGYAGMYPDLG